MVVLELVSAHVLSGQPGLWILSLWCRKSIKRAFMPLSLWSLGHWPTFSPRLCAFGITQKFCFGPPEFKQATLQPGSSYICSSIFPVSSFKRSTPSLKISQPFPHTWMYLKAETQPQIYHIPVCTALRISFSRFFKKTLLFFLKNVCEALHDKYALSSVVILT